MAMEKALKQLETRIDELITAHSTAKARVAVLEAKVRELEARLGVLGQTEERVRSLEGEREGLAERLKQVLAAIDQALVPDQGVSGES